MEHSSQKNLSKYSRGLERHTRNANGEPERQTPSSSHQPPTLTRSKYLNMTPATGPDGKEQGLPLKILPGACGLAGGRVEFFYE